MNRFLPQTKILVLILILIFFHKFFWSRVESWALIAQSSPPFPFPCVRLWSKVYCIWLQRYRDWNSVPLKYFFLSKTAGILAREFPSVKMEEKTVDRVRLWISTSYSENQKKLYKRKTTLKIWSRLIIHKDL